MEKYGYAFTPDELEKTAGQIQGICLPLVPPDAPKLEQKIVEPTALKEPKE